MSGRIGAALLVVGCAPTPDGGRAFTTDDVVLIQLVWADAGTIEGHLDAFEDDLRPGCGSFESVTNVGATQTVAEPVPIDTDGIGDRAIGWTATVSVSGQSGETGLVLVVVGEQATLVQEIGGEVDGDQLAALARTMVAPVEV